MDIADVNKSLDRIDIGLKAYVQLSDLRIQATVRKAEQIAYLLIENADIRTATIQMSLDRVSNLLLLRVSYGTLRLTIHSSPELIITILTFIMRIWSIIRFSIFIQTVLRIAAVLWRIHQIVASLWPEYRASWERLMSDVSKVSSYLGWGVDGIGHLVNAVGGGVNVLGGLMGKDWNLMRFEMMQKGSELAVQMSRMLQALKDDPGKLLNQLFENRTLLVADDTAKWWEGISNVITIASDKAETAVQGVQGVIGELTAIQENMPETVRNAIPISIWVALVQADAAINDYIRPTLTQIKNTLAFINPIMEALIDKNAELVAKIANPGDLLLGVDELSPWVKKYQEGLIDDVTSREFAFWTDQERTEMQGDFDEFDRIDRLATAPTPEPAYFSLEIAEGVTVRGITAEPHENWFVGDY